MFLIQPNQTQTKFTIYMKLTDPGYLIDFFEGYFCHNNVIDSPSDMSSLEPLTFQIKHFPGGVPRRPTGHLDQMWSK